MKKGTKIIKRDGREYYFRPCTPAHNTCLRCDFPHSEDGCSQDKHPTEFRPPCKGLGYGVFKKVVYRCPNCNSTDVWAQTELHLNTRRPNPKTLKLDYAFCNNCGESNRPKKCER